MDRRLVERLIGAVLLVAAGVLLIPWFLDTTADEGETVVLNLPAPQAPAEIQTVRVPLDRDTPLSPRPSPQTPAGQEQPSPPAEIDPAPAQEADEPDPSPTSPPPSVVEPPPASPPPVQSPPPSNVAAGWAVQVASYGVRANAERLADELRQQQLQSFIVTTPSGSLHQVRVGPVGSREQADALLRVVREIHPDAFVVSPQ